MTQRGKFIIILGPTGSGKSVLLNYIHERFPELVFSTSYTTREKRPGQENTSYTFVSKEEFEERIASGGFLEYAAYGANYYGTPKEEILEALAEGKILIKEMEVQGVRQVREQMPGDLVLIYIDAGSWEELERRVRARAPISDEEMEKRKKRYADELPFKEVADFVVANTPGKLEEAQEALKTAISTVTGLSPRA